VTLHDPAHLLDHAAWLRSLAASLVGDRATAARYAHGGV